MLGTVVLSWLKVLMEEGLVEQRKDYRNKIKDSVKA